LSFTIHDNMAYLYNYDYRTQDSQIKVFNLKAGKTERENFIPGLRDFHRDCLGRLCSGTGRYWS